MSIAPVAAPGPVGPPAGVASGGASPAAAQALAAVTATVDAAQVGMVRDATAAPETAPGVQFTPAQAAVAAMVSEAAISQDSLAPLLADLAAVQGSSALPPAASAAVGRLLAAQAPLDAAVTAETLRAAVGVSGIFLEAALAAGAPQLDTSSDLKAQLLQLSFNLAADPQGRAAAQQAVPQPPTRSQAPPRTLTPRPPPPARDGPTSGQSAASAKLGPETTEDDAADTLRQDVHGALSRLELLQAASLPRPGGDARWAFELPVGPRANPSIAQFEISRDGRRAGSAEAAEAVWRARFSLDVEPAGPVHAEVSLSGGRARVTLWAERDGARTALSARQGELASALSGRGAQAAVRVLAGAPEVTAIETGHFLDRTS